MWLADGVGIPFPETAPPGRLGLCQPRGRQLGDSPGRQPQWFIGLMLKMGLPFGEVGAKQTLASLYFFPREVLLPIAVAKGMGITDRVRRLSHGSGSQIFETTIKL